MNRIVENNPFGELSEDGLAAFEADLGRRLPNTYRNYLLNHNGGDFERQIYFNKRSKLDFEVSAFLGIHNGPGWARLEPHSFPEASIWAKLFRITGKKHISIGFSQTGESISIDLSKGSIFFWDSGPYARYGYRPIKLSGSFDEFVDGLLSESDFMNASLAPADQAAFAHRLDRAGKSHEEWLSHEGGKDPKARE